MLQNETRHEEDAQHRLRVTDHPVADQLQDFRQRLGSHLDEFVWLPRMLARSQVGRPKKVYPFVGKTGRRPYSSKTLEPPGCHTDFLQQLAARAHLWRFARIQASRRDFDQRPVCGIAVLLDEQDRWVSTAWIGREGQHSGLPRVPYDLELSCRAVGKAHRVDVDIYDPPAVNSLTRELHHPLRCLVLEQPAKRDFEPFCEQIPRVAAQAGMNR